jgi:hypothetical protein
MQVFATKLVFNKSFFLGVAIVVKCQGYFSFHGNCNSHRNVLNIAVSHEACTKTISLHHVLFRQVIIRTLLDLNSRIITRKA